MLYAVFWPLSLYSMCRTCTPLHVSHIATACIEFVYICRYRLYTLHFFAWFYCLSWRKANLWTILLQRQWNTENYSGYRIFKNYLQRTWRCYRFFGFCIIRFGIGLLHNCYSLCDFCFDFAEIFIIKNLLPAIPKGYRKSLIKDNRRFFLATPVSLIAGSRFSIFELEDKNAKAFTVV